MIRPLLLVALVFGLEYTGLVSLNPFLMTAVVGLALYRFAIRFVGRGWLVRSGKCVLVTGCDSGFGELTALRLDAIGVKVFAGCLTQEGADRLTKRSSSRIIAIVMDVTKDADVQRAYEKVVSSMSPSESLWSVVNNAGLYLSGLIEFVPMSDFQKQMDVNYLGIIRVTKQFLPLIRRSRGRIVSVASLVGLFAPPQIGAYASSKYAVEAAMDSLRREMHSWGVSVVLVEPGLHRTALMQDLNRRERAYSEAQSEEVKQAYGPAFMEVNAAIDKVPHGQPGAVCDVIMQALFARRAEERYQVGRDAVVLLPLSYLPAWIQDLIWRLLERLSGRALPLPSLACIDR